jgi:hypothetical protein
MFPIPVIYANSVNIINAAYGTQFFVKLKEYCISPLFIKIPVLL